MIFRDKSSADIFFERDTTTVTTASLQSSTIEDFDCSVLFAYRFTKEGAHCTV